MHLQYGYNRGLPPHVDSAWGCRAIVEQNGYVDVLWNRVDLIGPDQTQLADHLVHHVSGAWIDEASMLLRSGAMRTDVDREFVLFRSSTIVIKGNTRASHGYLYVCGYLVPRCDAHVCKGTGSGSCDEPLDDHEACPRAGDHIDP